MILPTYSVTYSRHTSDLPLTHFQPTSDLPLTYIRWEDVGLAPEGVAEAISAGRLLKKNKVEFDVVYTSWLSRAIETVAVVVAVAVVTMAIVLMMACCCAVHVTRACCCGAQAWIVLSELDDTWLPIHKSWRLNERMYGALTGLSKKKTRAQVQPHS